MSDGDDEDQLEHARRLADRVARRRGYTSADTELASDEGRQPIHLGLHADIGDLSTGLSITARAQIRGLRWQRRAEIWAGLVSLVALAVALVAVVLVVLR